MAKRRLTKDQERMEGLDYAFEVTVRDPHSGEYKAARGRITEEELERRSAILNDADLLSGTVVEIPDRKDVKRLFRYEVSGYDRYSHKPDKLPIAEMSAWTHGTQVQLRSSLWRKYIKRLRAKHLDTVACWIDLYMKNVERWGSDELPGKRSGTAELRKLGLTRFAELVNMGYVFSVDPRENYEGGIKNVVPQWVWLGYYLSSTWDALDFVYVSRYGDVYGDQELARIVYCGEKVPDKYTVSLREDVLVRFKPYPKQRYFLGSNVYEVLYGGARGGGKAQSLDSKILTPFGWTTFRDIKVGDTISNPVTGGTQRVIGKYPQGVQKLYRVTCDDRASCVVTGEHLWSYRRVNHVRPGSRPSSERDFAKAVLGYEHSEDVFNRYRLGHTTDLMDLVKDGEFPRIPLASPSIFTVNGRTPALPAYLLGLFIGDGHTESFSITTDDDETAEYLVSLGFTRSKDTQRFGAVGEVRKKLKDWATNHGLRKKLSYDKFIPPYIFTSSLSYRLDFIRGLMDTDGTVDKRGRCYFCSTSDQLAEGMMELIRGIGGKTFDRIKYPTYPYKGEKLNGKPAHDILVQIPKTSALFNLSRKKAKCKDSWNGGYEMSRSIKSIEYERDDEACCISVDSPHGLYITDDYIVTHNTFGMIHDAALHVRKFHYEADGTVVIDRQSIDYPEYTALILRRKYTDLILNFKPKANQVYAALGAVWKEKEMCFLFPSGARIYLGHCNEAKDVEKYIGGNYHYLGIEEVGQFPEFWVRDIGGSVRSTNPELLPLKRFTTNPGGVGHMWLKRRFVDSCPPIEGELKVCKEFDVEYYEQNPGKVFADENGTERWYIPATVFDNEALIKNDDNYVNFLKTLDPVKKKMWLHGMWDEMSGLFFSNFSNEYHVIDKRDFKLEVDKCRVYRCIDYGTTNPFACIFVAVDHEGRAICFDEIYETGLTPTMQAELILDKSKEWGLTEEQIHLTIVDPSMKVASQDSGHKLRSVIDLYSDCGIRNISLGRNARVPGWAVFRDYMRIPDPDEYGESVPMLRFTTRCKNVIETLPTLTVSPTNVEDLDTDGLDHAADAIRYLLMFIQSPFLRKSGKAEPDWLRKARGEIDGKGKSTESAWTA